MGKAFILICIIFISSNVQSAIVKYKIDNDNGYKRIKISLNGEIKKGDSKKIKDVCQEAKSQNLGLGAFLGLNSKGGDFRESLLITDIIFENSIETYISNESECYSACAIIFLTGNEDTQSGKGILPSRTMQKGGKLGFHAPYIEVNSGFYNSESINRAFSRGVSSVHALISIAAKANIDYSLIINLLEMKSRELLMFNTVDYFGKHFREVSIEGLQKYGKFRSVDELFNICINTYMWNLDEIDTHEHHTKTLELREDMYSNFIDENTQIRDVNNQYYYIKGLAFGDMASEAVFCAVEPASDDGYFVHYFYGGEWVTEDDFLSLDIDKFSTNFFSPDWSILDPNYILN